MFNLSIKFSISRKKIKRIKKFLEVHMPLFLAPILITISIASFVGFYQNGLGLSYNDARSHLDIGRRVVEGLKPGLAQIGSVWLPLPHLLMVPTIWNDFMWHTGLAGALQSMISFVVTGLLVYFYLKNIGVGVIARLFAVALFVVNVNILYLQSTAMTELLLMATMTAGSYYLLLWQKNENIVNLIKAAFYIMLSTLVRYDGWFLCGFAGLLIAIETLRKRSYKRLEGTIVLYSTLAFLGIGLWFLWNLVIFKDPLYFAFGPFSAHAQQEQLAEAGVLATKGNLGLSIKVYMYALFFNSYVYVAMLGFFGAIAFWFNKKVNPSQRLMSLALLAPFIFNIIALYLGHSVLFIQGISGDTWFNVRYGSMLAPTIAIFGGYLVERFKKLKPTLIGLTFFVLFFAYSNQDAVTIDDARVGSSQKNVSEVSGWLERNAKDKDGFILISAASHDAIIFSSNLPMKKYIHEGTGAYWESAVEAPDRWARWIVMRTNDVNDLTFKEIQDAPGFVKYERVDSYPFADIYQLKEEYLGDLNTKPVYSNQK